MADNDELLKQKQLIDQINRLNAENSQLQADLQVAIQNIAVIADNMDSMSSDVLKDLKSLQERTTTLEENTAIIDRAISDLSTRYFTFKNMSTASKNLTQYTDEYYTRFSDFNLLRRITLGYVIGLDNEIISSESLRKAVEKVYLQNTDYWLAYAVAAVMLWASDEKEAAIRAIRKSIFKDVCRTDVFFLLINLRFTRLNAAKEWYLDYLGKVDFSALGSEYQYLLETYLSGLFGPDPEFEEQVSDNIQKTIEKIHSVTVGFSGKFTDRARRYAETYLHYTENTYPTLCEISKDYDKLLWLLSRAECNAIFAKEYMALAQNEIQYSEDIPQRVEDVLYNLINAYDDQEWAVIKNQKYNEAILEAQGNLAAAKEKYNVQYAHLDQKRSLDQMMVDWAFSEDPTITSLIVKRFAISKMKDPIARGFEQFAESYRAQEPAAITVSIDDYSLECSEDDLPKQKESLGQLYERDKLKNAFKDKFAQIYGISIAASLLLLIITFFVFNAGVVSVGVLGGILGGFLLWRRLVELNKILAEKKRVGILKLQHAAEELGSWRQSFHDADAHTAEVIEVFNLFE